MEFKSELEKRTSQVQDIIYSFLPKEEGFQKNVISAMNYSMMAGGKRIRPMLMWETYKLFDNNRLMNDDAVKSFMAAMEMIHTYSLVHDDLPAMDDDEYRRGRKTTHIVYGYAMAILAGDGLLNYSFETAAKAFNEKNELQKVAKAMQILTSKPGVYGMLGGQAVDVENDDKTLDKATLDFIYELKTGALIEASMMIGAVLGGADDEQIDNMEKIASDIGMAFQIQDDILDVTSTTDELGKPVKSDEKNNKTTYVTLFGIDKASQMVSELSNEAVALLDKIPGDKEFLKELVLALVSRKK